MIRSRCQRFTHLVLVFVSLETLFPAASCFTLLPPTLYRHDTNTQRFKSTSLQIGKTPSLPTQPLFEESILETSLAGKIMPFLSKFVLERSERVAVFQALARAVDLREFAIIATIGWASVPLSRKIYNIRYNIKPNSKAAKAFDHSWWFQLVRNLSWAAKVGTLIYTVDCVGVLLKAIGFDYLQSVHLGSKAATTSLFVWILLLVKRQKRGLLQRALPQTKSGHARAMVYDRVTDTLLYVITATVIMDRLRIQFGVTLSSLFAFGGVGTLVLSLASQDLATQLVSGLSIRAAGSFMEGDKIKLGDGTSGVVHKIGLLYTEIRGADEIITKIPNPQISNQRMSNISRITTCQVQQTLWFRHEDISKLPRVILAIQHEIQESCPSLITDASRPFRVHWSGYESDHLQVQVDCRFSLPPFGSVYWKNRQAVLEAIARAVQKERVEFAIPSYISKNVELSRGMTDSIDEGNQL